MSDVSTRRLQSRTVPVCALPSRRRARGALVAALFLSLVGTACASTKTRVAYSPHDLRTEVMAKVPIDRRGDVVVPFEVSPELLAQARDYVSGITTDYARANALLAAITDEARFGISWEPVTTTVAQVTAKRGHGNCLSLTSLYVGLARGVGLRAYYVDASDRVNELTREDELLIDTGHIAATVKTERGWSMVDFAGEISNFRTFRVIDDVEALAHFYNNRGYERIVQAHEDGLDLPWDDARDDFTMAVSVLPTFSRALNNLGVASSRLGDEDAAEWAYLRAVAADDEFAAPRHNLGNLHLRRGEFDEAIRWYRVAIKMQSKNPYLRFHLGLAQYQAGDIPGSIESFERAIALKHDYPEPRNLLAQAYRSQGRFEEAERVRRASGGSHQE